MGMKYKAEVDEISDVPSDGVDRDSEGESGHGARAGRDTETECLSRLKPGVPILLYCLDPPRPTIGTNLLPSFNFKTDIFDYFSSSPKEIN